MNERNKARKQSKQCKASKQVSGASKQANGRASGPGFTSRFLAVRNHSVLQSATPLCSIFPFSFSHTFLPFLASLLSPLPFLPILFSAVNCLPRFLFICFYLFSTWRIVIAVMFFPVFFPFSVFFFCQWLFLFYDKVSQSFHWHSRRIQQQQQQQQLGDVEWWTDGVKDQRWI